MTLDQRTINKVQIGSLSGVDQRTLEGQLKVFLLSCRVEELSPWTIKGYDQKLSVFVRFLAGLEITDPHHITPHHITPHHIRLFLLKLQDTCQRVSVYNNYRAIKRFFAWMVDEGTLKQSPMSSIRLRKPPDKIIQPFKPEQIQDLLLLCDDSKFLGARNKAIILTFLDTGLRLSELANIQLKDIDFDRETIKVMGKGAKERVVRIGKKAQKAILRYLLMRNDGLPCLWVSEERRPLTHWGIELMIGKLGKRAGFTGVRCSPHTFRHSFATTCLRNGMGEFALQLILGHESLYMTRRYVSTLGVEDSFKAHQKASPVDNMKF